MLARIVQKARISAGFSSRPPAAERLDISAEALRRIENGSLLPGNRLLGRIVEGFQMSEMGAQRLYKAAFKERRAQSKILQEQEELKRKIHDLGITKMASHMAAEILDALNDQKRVEERQLFRDIERIVKRALKSWEGS